jgi:hypothetical protein
METGSDNLMYALKEIGIEAHPPGELIYKYVDLDTAEKIIEGHSLKFSSPTTFNDPFDLNNSLIDFSGTKRDFKSLIDQAKGSMNHSERKKLLNESVKRPENIFKAYNQAFNKERETCGISCFSKSFNKTLMWSHYADKHKGVCLGFSINPLDNGYDFLMLCVKYAHEIKPLNYFKKRNVVLFNWLFTKSHVWSYEEEARLYLNRNGLVNFGKECLKEIHFGVRTPKESIEKIKQLLKKNKYSVDRFTKMSIDAKTFDLSNKEIH